MKCDYCSASYSTATEVYIHVERSGCRQRHDERERAIRAVLAAQWVAALLWVTLELYVDGRAMKPTRPAVSATGFVGDWYPTAQQIVDGVLQ